MKAQLGRIPEWLEYFGAIAFTAEGTVPPFSDNKHLNYVRRVPLGVCALITPWNHPLLIATKKIAPALAAGNTIVVKPSELAPIAVIELAKVLEAVRSQCAHMFPLFPLCSVYKLCLDESKLLCTCL